MKKLLLFSFVILLTSLSNSSYSQSPKLFVKDISFPAPSPLQFNVGNTEELVYVIKNIGSPGSKIDTILFQCHQPTDAWFYPTGTGNEKYYLTWPNDSVLANYYTRYTYPFFPPTHHNSYSLDSVITHYNAITPNMISALTGKNYLGQNDSLIIHVPYYVVNCSNTSGSMNFTADSTVGHRAVTVVEPINISVTTGDPQFSGAPNIFDSAYFCSAVNKDTAVVGFRITNIDPTAGDPVLPYADSLKLYLYCTNVAQLDTSTFKINGVKISGNYIVPYTNGTNNVYLIKMYNFPAGLHGDTLGTNTIMDLSGRGKADELAKGQSFELTATIVYNSGCPAYANCGTTAWTLPGFVAQWNNQCLTLPYTSNLIDPGQSPIFADLIRYFYEGVTGTSTMNVPSDITNSSPDFNASICVNNYDQFWNPKEFAFDCPHADYKLVMPMPRGYHLDTALLRPFSGHFTVGVKSRVFKFHTAVVANPYPGCGGSSYTDTNATVQEFFSPTDSIIINFDSLPLSTACNGAYVPDCFNVPLALNCGDFDSTNVNIEPDMFNYRYEYICDNVSPCNTCPDILACGSTTTWHHCAGLCSFPPYTLQGWILDRTNFGYFNQNLPNFYDNCGGSNGVIPSPADLVTDTIPIDSSAAYPGDQMKILVNGGFISQPKLFNDVYLDIKYGILAGASKKPYYLFELDPTQTSYFIVGNCRKVPALNGTHLNLPACPFVNPTCGDFWDSARNNAGMNFSLYSAIQNMNVAWYDSIIHDDTNENMTIAAHIYIRVRNDGLKSAFESYPDFLQQGKNVVNMRTQYMADKVDSPQVQSDTVPSCDPWGGKVTLLETNPGLEISTSTGVTPTTQSTCDTFNVEFVFVAPTAVSAQDDFPYEFRPIAELDDSVRVILPKGYTYAASQFFTFVDNWNSSVTDNHFAGSSTLQSFTVTPSSVTPIAGGRTLVTYIGLGGGTSCWPLFDQKSSNANTPQGYYLTVKTLPSCHANDTDTVSCISGFRIGTQQSSSSYQVHIIDSLIKVKVTHQNPVDYVSTPPAVSDFSDTIKFAFKLCDSTFDSPIPWIAFENVNGFLLDMGVVTLYDKTTHTLYPNASGYRYFNAPDNGGIVFDLNSLGANTCDSMLFTGVVEDSSRACPPVGTLAQMLVRFGNVCDGDSIIKNPDSAQCENRVDTFSYHVYPTTLQLFQSGYRPAFVHLCGDTLIDSLVIESANLGTVNNPMFWVFPPVGSGIVVDTVIETYPCDTNTFTPRKGSFAPDTTILSGGSTVLAYGWSFNKDLHINGLPGTIVHPSSSDSNNICVKVYMTMNCNYNGTSPIKYLVTGRSACNTLLKDSLDFTPTVDDTCCLNLPVCTNADGKYDLIINNQSARSLHAGATTYSCENILVVGTYTVNEDVTINNCNIAFAPHALVYIDSNHTLNITSNEDTCSHKSECNHLYGACDTMWRGIFIEAGSELDMAKNVLLEDADTAIYAINTSSTQATYKLGGDLTVLNKNYKDIVVSPYSHYYTGYATSCLFTCRDFDTITPCDWFNNYHDAPFATLKYPHTGLITSIGWQIDSVKHFEDNFGIRIGGINCFDNLDRGILSYGSNVVICTDTFQNFRNYPAITANGDTSNPDSLYVGGPNTYNEANIFNSCFKGILAQNGFSSVNIVYNRFKDSATAVFPGLTAINVANMDVTGSTLNIEEDSIINFQNGMVLNLNTHVTAKIIYNTITDTVCKDSIRAGIVANEAGSSSAIYTIDANNITVFNGGIAVNDLAGCTIASNHISLGNRVNGCASSRYKGFGVNATGCTGPIISCNTVTAPTTTVVNPNAYKGVVEKQSTSVVFVRDTTIRAHIHILFNGTSTGNLWYNNLTGVTGDTGIQNKASGITDFGSNADPTDNKFSGTFTCKTSSSPVYHTTMSVLSLTPSCPINYSHTNLNGSHTCPTVPSVITNKTARVMSDENVDTVGVDSLTLAGMLNTALSRDTFYINKDTNVVLAKWNVLSMIWQHPYLLANNILSRFNDSMSHAPIGQIAAIDSAMVSAYGAVNYSNLSGTLNTVRPNNNIEHYLQIATQGYLDYKISGKISPNELISLRTVATMCPDFNGQGVYLARSLVSLYDTVVVIYNDDCSGNGDQRIMSPKRDKPGNLFRLYPNPNNGGFTVEYSLQQGQTGELTIYNLLGEKEAQYLLNAANNKMAITNSYLNAGIHLYVVRVNNNEVKRDKLIIIK